MSLQGSNIHFTCLGTVNGVGGLVNGFQGEVNPQLAGEISPPDYLWVPDLSGL